MKSNGKNNRKNDIPLNVQKAKQEQAAAEKAAEQQATFIDFWETMTENEYMKYVQMINSNQISIASKIFNKDLLQFFKMKIAQENEQIAEESKDFFDLLPQMHDSIKQSMLEFINDHLTDEQTHVDYVSLVKMSREMAVTEHKQEIARQAEIENELAELRAAQAELAEQELERLEKVGDLIEENLRNEELEEEEIDRLEKEFFKGYAQETEIEEVTEVTEVQNEILTQNPKTEMKTQEVVNENTSVNNTQTIVNQQVTNNTLNVTLETPKPKMSIADKIVEAQKMLLIAERKQLTEDRLKAFHGYLHANRDGDNFRLMSSDEKYKFSTNNIELVKEVNIVLERFFKTKIQEFETELANFQI